MEPAESQLPKRTATLSPSTAGALVRSQEVRRSLSTGSLDGKGFLPSGFKSSPADAFLVSQEAAFAPGNGMFSELGLTQSIPGEGTSPTRPIAL